MAFLRGEIRILYIKIGPSYVAVGCLTSNSFAESVEQLTTTTRDNGGWSTFRPTTQSYSIDFSGIQDPDNTIDYTELKTYKRERTRVEWKLEATGASLIDYGYGYITDLSEEATAGDLLTYSGTLQGYGKPVELGDDQPPTAPLLDPLDFLLLNNLPVASLLTWSGATDDVAVTGYQVRISGSDNSTEIIDVGNVTTYGHAGLQQGFSYAYNVRAYDIAGNFSPWSNKRFFSVPIAPSAPDQTRPMLFQDGTTVIYQDGTAAQFQ